MPVVTVVFETSSDQYLQGSVRIEINDVMSDYVIACHTIRSKTTFSKNWKIWNILLVMSHS